MFFCVLEGEYVLSKLCSDSVWLSKRVLCAYTWSIGPCHCNSIGFPVVYVLVSLCCTLRSKSSPWGCWKWGAHAFVQSVLLKFRHVSQCLVVEAYLNIWSKAQWTLFPFELHWSSRLMKHFITFGLVEFPFVARSLEWHLTFDICMYEVVPVLSQYINSPSSFWTKPQCILQSSGSAWLEIRLKLS